MPENTRSGPKSSKQDPQTSRVEKQRKRKQPQLDVGSDFTQRTFENHAAVLDGMSNQMYSAQRSAMVLQLQRDYGNPYVQRLVDHISRKRAKAVQTKLTVGAAGDKYEQEADSVAKEVMGSLASPNAEAAQRQGEEEELQMQPLAQREIDAEGGDVDSGMESTIHQAKGGGQPMADGVRSSMEGAFGTDFSGVRLHTGPEANALNRSMSARAFTTGQDIFFSEGAYNPETSAGKETLAHELTHVVQQTGATAQGDVQRGFLRDLFDKLFSKKQKYEALDTVDESDLEEWKKKIARLEGFLAELKAAPQIIKDEGMFDASEFEALLEDIREELSSVAGSKLGGPEITGPSLKVKDGDVSLAMVDWLAEWSGKAGKYVSGEKEISKGKLDAEGSYEGMVGVKGDAKAKGTIAPTEITAEIAAKVFVGIQGKIGGKIKYNKDGTVGAFAKGDAEMKLGLDASAAAKLGISSKGLEASIKAGAFAGLQATAKGAAGMSAYGRELFSLTGKLTGKIGAGAKFEAKVAATSSKMSLSFDASATVGLGGGLGGGLTVDFANIALSVEQGRHHLANWEAYSQGYQSVEYMQKDINKTFKDHQDTIKSAIKTLESDIKNGEKANAKAGF